ncbi:60S ribosomal protein L17-2-like [Pyrus ussuriensis x Pyrus communis]|uniref:60S ribosomal protein L17-2-like n=1 Tax=Pyrus ussuriensis x Pyrus communis TaxID=2448454 RepID=A0A5N5G611_9ROSA|nr:60S ribosomal protein L17-2-like [Pyrus ussuriensis x Pyrus communis]
MHLAKAKRCLEDVLAHKQANNHQSNGQGHWPVKFANFILDLLKNAEVKGLDVDSLYVSHFHVVK